MAVRGCSERSGPRRRHRAEPCARRAEQGGQYGRRADGAIMSRKHVLAGEVVLWTFHDLDLVRSLKKSVGGRLPPDLDKSMAVAAESVGRTNILPVVTQA